MNPTNKLIASISTHFTRFDASSDLDKNASCMLLPMSAESYRQWKNIVSYSGKLIERRPLAALASFNDIESKWAIFGQGEVELVLMSTEQFWGSFMPASARSPEHE